MSGLTLRRKRGRGLAPVASVRAGSVAIFIGLAALLHSHACLAASEALVTGGVQAPPVTPAPALTPAPQFANPQVQSAPQMSSMDQMLKTEEHTVKALENMYTVATWVAGGVIILFGFVGFKSFRDFTEKLNQAQIDFNKIKNDSESEIRRVRSDSEAEVKKLNDELSKAVEQRTALQKEHAERIASLEETRKRQLDSHDELLSDLNQKIIDATELTLRVETIDREMAKVWRLPRADQANCVRKSKNKLLSNLEEAREFSERLKHTRLQSWIEAQHGRLHLSLGEREDARTAMLKAEQLDAARNPDRSFNLACLYGDWFKADDADSSGRHDVEAMRWANETVARAIATPHPSKSRGYWLNLLETDIDLEILRGMYKSDFEEMRKRLTF